MQHVVHHGETQRNAVQIFWNMVRRRIDTIRSHIEQIEALPLGVPRERRTKHAEGGHCRERPNSRLQFVPGALTQELVGGFRSVTKMAPTIKTTPTPMLLLASGSLAVGSV